MEISAQQPVFDILGFTSWLEGAIVDAGTAPVRVRVAVGNGPMRVVFKGAAAEALERLEESPVSIEGDRVTARVEVKVGDEWRGVQRTFGRTTPAELRAAHVEISLREAREEIAASRRYLLSGMDRAQQEIARLTDCLRQEREENAKLRQERERAAAAGAAMDTAKAQFLERMSAPTVGLVTDLRSALALRQMSAEQRASLHTLARLPDAGAMAWGALTTGEGALSHAEAGRFVAELVEAMPD